MNDESLSISLEGSIMYEEINKKTFCSHVVVRHVGSQIQATAYLCTNCDMATESSTNTQTSVHKYFNRSIHTPPHMSCYLVKSEGPDRIGGQLHCVQQSDLDEAVGLCAPCRPVLITLHLHGEEGRRCERCRAVCICLYTFLWRKRERESWLGVRVLVYRRQKKGGECWSRSVRELFLQIQTVMFGKNVHIATTQHVKSGFNKCVEWRVTERETGWREREICFLGWDPAYVEL